MATPVMTCIVLDPDQAIVRIPDRTEQAKRRRPTLKMGVDLIRLVKI